MHLVMSQQACQGILLGFTSLAPGGITCQNSKALIQAHLSSFIEELHMIQIRQ